MTRHAMAAMGAMLLAVLAAGCANQADLSAVSALARPDSVRPDVSQVSVRVDLRDILVP